MASMKRRRRAWCHQDIDDIVAYAISQYPLVVSYGFWIRRVTAVNPLVF